MSISTTQQATPIGAKLVTETAANATADTDIVSGSATIYMIDIDNSAVAATTYVKLYNNANPTVGTTAPDMVLMVAATTRRVFPFPEGIAFGTAVSFAAVTTGGTSGTTSPTGSVVVRLLTS